MPSSEILRRLIAASDLLRQIEGEYDSYGWEIHAKRALTLRLDCDKLLFETVEIRRRDSEEDAR